MSDWQTIDIHFNALEPLVPPLQAVLQVLEAIQAILEAVMDVVRAFLLDLTNPILAIVALLLAAVRSIINQLSSAGFSILLVHPNFDTQDFNQVLSTVSGSYPAFQSKVLSKIYDLSDINRPTYPVGSAVAMLILYIGEDSPGDLFNQLFALLNFINHNHKILPNINAPVELTVTPVFQSGNAVAQFSDLFSANPFSINKGYNNQLSLSWRMPNSPAGYSNSFISQLTAFANAFQFTNFIIERSRHPMGVNVPITVTNSVSNQSKSSLTTNYDFTPPNGQVDLREKNGNIYRDFETKINVTGTDLAFGYTTGTYQYLDKGVDNNGPLLPGVPYYYRVRAYFGDPSAWLKVHSTYTTVDSDAINNLIVADANRSYIMYSVPGSNVTMGQPSPVVRGIVPQVWPGNFNPYSDINDAVQVGALLNFDFPPAQKTDTTTVQAQKTGWGTLSTMGGQMFAAKSAFNNSQKLFANLIFQSSCRRVANACISNMNPALANILSTKWNSTITTNSGSGTLAQTINKVIGVSGSKNPNAVTSFTGMITPGGASKRPGPEIGWTFPPSVIPSYVTTYLMEEQKTLESPYNTGQQILGPLPTLSSYTVNGTDISVSVAERQALAQFLQLCLSTTSNVGYLSWYSITLGDLFPSLMSFLNDIEQFILALMKALQSIIQEIEAIINTIIQKIQQLEDLINMIIQILQLLDITLNVSILGYSSSNGSVDDLAQALVNSTDQPGNSPFGLHSGMVMTFGGPGAGVFDALSFILGI